MAVAVNDDEPTTELIGHLLLGKTVSKRCLLVVSLHCDQPLTTRLERPIDGLRREITRVNHDGCPLELGCQVVRQARRFRTVGVREDEEHR